MTSSRASDEVFFYYNDPTGSVFIFPDKLSWFNNLGNLDRGHPPPE